MKDIKVKSLCSYGLIILEIFIHISNCNGHGRLIEPPSRASAWRYGFNTPPDYNDHELYCGGFTRQWDRNGGKCGECGDPWDVPVPRPHEQGGTWGLGVIVRKYAPKSEMTIRIELTASHMGYFEFRLCPKPNAKQECLDKHLLRILSGTPSQPQPNDLKTRFYPRNGSTIYTMKSLLPDIKCHQCVLQWRYIAGNNWGKCSNGSEGLGCGPQEEFRSCSDITIGDGFTISTTESTIRTDTETSDNLNIVLLIFIFALILGLCIYIGWYMRRNSALRQRWKVLLENVFRRKENIKTETHTTLATQAAPPIKIYISSEDDTLKSSTGEDATFETVPLPPPRSKRNRQVKDLNNMP